MYWVMERYGEGLVIIESKLYNMVNDLYMFWEKNVII